MPTLILLRHAKSDYPPGVPDRERPLSPRGERDAVAAGVWLGAAYPRVDAVIVSPARRAAQTWNAVRDHVAAISIRTDDRIYEDWGSALLDVVAELPAHVRTALIVGHNPGIEECAAALAFDGEAEGIARLRRKYPTSGIAVLCLPGTWAEPGSGILAALAVPRG